MFYDGACSICLREVQFYQRLDRDRRILWLDINGSNSEPCLAEYGLTPETAMRELHVRDRDGCMHRGVDAFIALWTVLPGFRWFAAVARWPVMHAILSHLYRPFARWRLRRQCAKGYCDTTP